MAWHSSGRSNAELVRNMHRGGLIRSDKVLKAFIAVDRGHFVPREKKEYAYIDEPVHSAPFHLSAPHMYATVLEALDLSEGLSFLNVGSGSGYLSFLVARIVGHAVNHGIEQHRELVEHAMSRCAEVSELHDLNHLRFRVGDAFNIDTESGQRYDRIYIGAGCQQNVTAMYRQMLAIGGVMVAPLEDELVCITRLSEVVFVTRVITNVRFQGLAEADPRMLKHQPKVNLNLPIVESVAINPVAGISMYRVMHVL
jgi:protein-L-isoaspartate(D-aspartate) O-methyltransferase